MDILYCPVKEGNFGDNLNLYLWDRLLPGLQTIRPSEAILGVGTLQGTRIPSHVTAVHVLGSGSHGEAPGPWLQGSPLKIHFVRGPKTASLWGCPDKAITDGAILLTKVGALQEKKPPVRARIGFIPHHKSDRLADYRAACELAGLHHISPRTADPEWFINEVRSCTHIITEALHGAVISDIYRIPWVATQSASYINDFKWRDWSESLGLRHEPHSTSFVCTRGIGLPLRIENMLKRGFSAIGIGKRRWKEKRVLFDDHNTLEIVANELRAIAQGDFWKLSTDAVFARLLDRTDAAWEAFEHDVGV